MKASLNPFSPGSGLRPPALVGRDAELTALSDLTERSRARLPSRGIVLSGLRGVGKTVLLNEMRTLSEDAGWFVVSLEGRPDAAGAASARQTLARDIGVRARALAARPTLSQRLSRALGSVSSFQVQAGATGISVGIDVTPGRADSGDIVVDLLELVDDLCAALTEDGSAFGLFIDEMQDLDDEMLRALLVTQHEAGQRGWPFFILGAGLPNLPGVLAEVRSYAERLFDYRTIGKLAETDATEALRDPLSSRGVEWEPEALGRIVAAADGFPYFLQEYGRASWEVAAASPITVADSEASVSLGLERLDAGFFLSRWNRATRSERRLLVAMAEDGEGPSLSSEVARRMGLKPSSLGPFRAKLIAKGLVYAPEHGQLAYTVPGMAAYVDRHREDDA